MPAYNERFGASGGVTARKLVGKIKRVPLWWQQ